MHPHYTQQQRGQGLRPIEVPERHTVCMFPGCGKAPLSRGWCPGHYTQERHGHPMTPLRLVDPDRGCAVPGCPARHYAHGLCRRHVGKGGHIIRDFWEFTPSHSIVMLTNHRPVVKGDDEGIWRRLRVVPFDVIVPKAEQDGQLKDKLREEIDGILTWLVAGCLAWQHSGLDEPERAREATGSYRSDSDALGAFLDERCLTYGHAHVRSSELYAT